MESEKRVTCQKKIILDYLKSVQTHPSAEIIFKKVRKKLPRISLGTVYRNLKVMKERGDILEISSQIARYDGDVSSHSHFVCEKCGEIFDIFQQFIPVKAIFAGVRSGETSDRHFDHDVVVVKCVDQPVPDPQLFLIQDHPRMQGPMLRESPFSLIYPVSP